LPNARVEGITDIAGAEPLPDSGTSVVPVLSMIRRVADLAPSADGLNFTVIVALP